MNYISVFLHLLIQKASTFSEQPPLTAFVQVCVSTIKQLLQLQQLSGSEEFSVHSFVAKDYSSLMSAHTFFFFEVSLCLIKLKTFIFINNFTSLTFINYLATFCNKQFFFLIKRSEPFLPLFGTAISFFVWLLY